jgi:hypothetical protein
VRWADNLATFTCRLSRNSGASTSWSLRGLSRPVQGQFYLYLLSDAKRHRLPDGQLFSDNQAAHSRQDIRRVHFSNARNISTRLNHAVSIMSRSIGHTTVFTCCSLVSTEYVRSATDWHTAGQMKRNWSDFSLHRVHVQPVHACLSTEMITPTTKYSKFGDFRTIHTVSTFQASLHDRTRCISRNIPIFSPRAQYLHLTATCFGLFYRPSSDNTLHKTQVSIPRNIVICDKWRNTHTLHKHPKGLSRISRPE